MGDALNPQGEQMADESMVRNLAAQAEAIWPQEAPLFARYALPATARVLDAGCGTGEVTARLAALFPAAELLGVDIIASHLELARRRTERDAQRVRFEERSIFDLGLPARSFDLVVCRHVLQAVPHAEQVVAELVRVTRPGGVVHLLVEDYAMLHFEPHALDTDPFWSTVPRAFGAAVGTDNFVGRKAFGMLRRLGLRDVTVDYAVVDPLRVPRETVAGIFGAWRDGYANALAAASGMPEPDVRAAFDDMLATLRDPNGYAVWHVPIVAGRVP